MSCKKTAKAKQSKHGSKREHQKQICKAFPPGKQQIPDLRTRKYGIGKEKKW